MFGTKCYEQAVGFSAMEADELVYVNGGSGSSGCYMGKGVSTTNYETRVVTIPAQEPSKSGWGVKGITITIGKGPFSAGIEIGPK